MIDAESKKLIKAWKSDWCKFAKDVLKAGLDPQQEEILRAVQHHRRVSVSSGTARGKDYVAAVASVCGLLLMPDFDHKGILRTSTVINTAPSDRQVKNIMMREIRACYSRSLLPKLAEYGFSSGRILNEGIKFDMPDILRGNPVYANIEKWYLLAFKADNHNTEAWTGFHNDNIMVVVTEASGINKVIYEGIEGCLQGNSRLLLVFNPNHVSGEAYNASRDPQYKHFKLSSLTAPNVLNGIKLRKGEITQAEYAKLHINGQVDFDWVDERVKKQGWCTRITKAEIDRSKHDFEWMGHYYRPSDVFKIKVLGEFPSSPDGKLIPLSWVEEAQARWVDAKPDKRNVSGGIRGVDVAGLGTDTTIFCDRKDNYVADLQAFAFKKSHTLHMELSGMIKQDAPMFAQTYIDTIGEGAGVYSRCAEMELKNVYSFKNSYGAKGLTDKTGARGFVNMRDYTYWAMRDWLDPQFNSTAMLPPDDELKAQLTEAEFKFNSDGRIKVEPKDDIKKRLGMSPDKADALAQTFAPTDRFVETGNTISPAAAGFFN
jgi:hypothetical protein